MINTEEAKRWLEKATNEEVLDEYFWAINAMARETEDLTEKIEGGQRCRLAKAELLKRLQK